MAVPPNQRQKRRRLESRGWSTREKKEKRRRAETRHYMKRKQKHEEKAEKTVVLQLVQLKNGWRIDDIIYPDDNASLRAVLTAILEE